VLQKLHGIGILHGDFNRYNFIVDKSTGNIRMVDFEHALHFEGAKAAEEFESLASELIEDTGRGGSLRDYHGSTVC
jgi:RIO-like serine/threonine protein kinase